MSTTTKIIIAFLLLFSDYLAVHASSSIHKNPYLNANTMPSSFNTGASFFDATNLHVPATNTPQLAWFKSLGLQS
ncbi:unnamed protein product, partial [Brassica oleracea]